MNRQEKIRHATQRGGKPMIALTPNNWALILRLLDEEVQRQEVLTGTNHAMLKIAVGDIINRIEDQL